MLSTLANLLLEEYICLVHAACLAAGILAGTDAGDPHNTAYQGQLRQQDQGDRRLQRTLPLQERRQCLPHCLATLEMASRQVAAWTQRRNQQQVTIHWRFTAEDASFKLKHLSPSVED